MSEENLIRQDKWYTYGDVKFFISDFNPNLQEIRFLMLKVIEQTVRDYCTLRASKLMSEKVLWEEAQDFIYDIEYRFMWGDLEVSLEAFLDILDIDVSYFRESITKRFNSKDKK